MKNIKSKIVGYGIWILLFMLSVAVVKDITRAKRIGAQIQAERVKVEKIKADNDKLSAQIAQAQDPTFIEKEVRDKLGLGKPGEAMVVLPDEDVLRKLAPVITSESDSLPDPIWKKWAKLFF